MRGPGIALHGVTPSIVEEAFAAADDGTPITGLIAPVESISASANLPLPSRIDSIRTLLVNTGISGPSRAMSQPNRIDNSTNAKTSQYRSEPAYAGHSITQSMSLVRPPSSPATETFNNCTRCQKLSAEANTTYHGHLQGRPTATHLPKKSSQFNASSWARNEYLSSIGSFLPALPTGASSLTASWFPTAEHYDTSSVRDVKWAAVQPSQYGNETSLFTNATENYLRLHPPFLGQIGLISNQTNCSGVLVSYRATITTVVTSTIFVNETVTLGPNATAPLPYIITPLPACQTITKICAPHAEGRCPVFPLPPGQKGQEPRMPETTSTLLVTKKNPAIIRQGQAVGNIFGHTTTTQDAAAAAPLAHQTPAGGGDGKSPGAQETHSSESSGGEIQVQSDGGVLVPGTPVPAQNPQAGNTPSENPQIPDEVSQQSGAPSNEAQTSSGAIAGGQGAGMQTSSGHSGPMDQSDSEGTVIGTPASGDPSSDRAGDNSQDQSTNGSTETQTSSSVMIDEQATQENSGSLAGEYAPMAFTANSLLISIARSMIIVGSETVKAGAPPTTFVDQDQTIIVQPSQILAGEKVLPIQAIITPPPVTSFAIEGIPVVLQSDHVVIGSQSFVHGSSAEAVTYNGQTFSWDADHLVGPETTVAFPSQGSGSAPRITAANQVFNVFPSSLEAAGLTLTLPKTSSTSSFMYNGQSFILNPSQLIAPDRSITVPTHKDPTAFVYGGHTFSIDRSQLIAPSATVTLSAGSGVMTYEGQTLTVDDSRIAGPSTTFALPAEPSVGNTQTPSAITTEGLTLSLGPSAVIVESSTYSFLPGQTPTTITGNGKAIRLGPTGVRIGSVDISLPTVGLSYSMLSIGQLTLSLAPSRVVVHGHTKDVRPGMVPINTIVDGQTISIGPHGVRIGSIAVPLPTPSHRYQVITEGDLTVSVAPSEAVIQGTTFAIGPSVPATMVVDDQTLSVGPHGIYFPGTTVDLPTMTSEIQPAAVAADGWKFCIEPNSAVIGNSVYPIGENAPAQTIMIGSKTVSLGVGGVMFPSTTIPPAQIPSPMSVDEMIMSVDATQAIINGTTYQVGPGAMATTVVAGSQVIRLGTEGIMLPTTIISPWKNATALGRTAISGAGVAFGSALPTGLPGSCVSKAGGPRIGAGNVLRPSIGTLLGFIFAASAVVLLVEL